MSVASKPNRAKGAKSRAATPAPSQGAGTSPRGIPWLLVLPILFALAGIGIAIYLTIVHYAKVPLACPTGTSSFLGFIPINVNCVLVTSSPYSVIGTSTVPITVPGIAWFVVSGGLAGIGLMAYMQNRPAPEWLPNVQILWSLVGLASILYLIYVEVSLLKAFCEWCTGVHLLIILTFLVTAYQWQRTMASKYAA